MAVVENTSSEIGDVIFMKTENAVTGLTSITGFTDSTVGETAERFFIKKFRYSLDGGLNYNQESYIDLTSQNLLSIPVDPTYDVFFEYRYERGGTDDTELLTWNFTSLNTVNIPLINGPVFDNSVFKNFFETYYHPAVVEWSLNVAEKLYRPGILPLSMTRDESQNINQEDRDFIDFWRTVTHFYSLLVNYARSFESYRENQLLLTDYLRQRGVFICDNQSIVDLQYIQENFWDEMRHRGTLLITKPKGTLINGNEKGVDGELLRLICYRIICDEFLFSISEFDTIGWVVNRWSPLWQGISHQQQLNKIYEKLENPSDLSKYPLISQSNVSLVDDLDVGNVIRIDSVPSGNISGIGVALGAFDEDFAINVDSGLTYELSFLVKVSGDNNSPLTIKIHTYNQNGIPTIPLQVDTVDFIESVTILDQVNLIKNTFVKVSVLIFPSTQEFINEDNIKKPNILVGSNLKFKSNQTCKIIPEIILDNTSGGQVSGILEIYNILLTPSCTEYSTGFLNTKDFVQTWIKNNQGAFTNENIEQSMKSFLLPYAITLKNNYL